MQIILVSSRLSPARTLHLKPRHIVAGFGLLALLALIFALAISWIFLHWRLPTTEWLNTQATAEASGFDRNLKALAMRIGELQARMMRLDSQSQRLSAKTGVRTEVEAMSQGGPFIPAAVDETGLTQEIERLADRLEEKSLLLDTVEREIRTRQISLAFLPTTLPVRGGARLGSPFGVRLDPFGRGRAMHEGLDFVAPFATPILAAADGVVVFAAFHPEFGNLVEINHGGERITRYAHMSAFSVTAGEAVRRGQEVGKLGSTGRSTGAHLHFEVRQNGVAVDPAIFLAHSLEKQVASRP
ncbi:MAG: M23 family metallopeptidase [Zoogloeaceae bacterium]|nr:M23 family metallopeptidase [Zoogloeaceae bacterium]